MAPPIRWKQLEENDRRQAEAGMTATSPKVRRAARRAAGDAGDSRRRDFGITRHISFRMSAAAEAPMTARFSRTGTRTPAASARSRRPRSASPALMIHTAFR